MSGRPLPPSFRCIRIGLIGLIVLVSLFGADWAMERGLADRLITSWGAAWSEGLRN